MARALVVAGCLLATAACGGARDAQAASDSVASGPSAEERQGALDSAGERFVKLALAIGVHDADFVDAYFGPPEFGKAATAVPPALADLLAEADALYVMLDDLPVADSRAIALQKSVAAAQLRIRMAMGETYPFDVESATLFDVVAPVYDRMEFDAALAEIDTLLPGDAALSERVEAFRNSLAIPKEKLLTVFEAAIAECRRRTLENLELPEGEQFDLAFVTDKPWSGYNWYQGGYRSRIEINTDLPIIIDRAVDLGCHEGYPGHHVWNSLIERDLVLKAGRIENAIYPLLSPGSLIAEGSANYGVDLAFPGEEKLAFEKATLYPLAGLDPEKAETLHRINKSRRRLSHVSNHVAREYLDGRIGREDAIEFLQKYDLSSRERAEQRVRFIDRYRAYVVNYNVGRDLVEAHIAGAGEDADARWRAFEALLSSGKTASDLAKQR